MMWIDYEWFTKWLLVPQIILGSTISPCGAKQCCQTSRVHYPDFRFIHLSSSNPLKQFLRRNALKTYGYAQMVGKRIWEQKVPYWSLY